MRLRKFRLQRWMILPVLALVTFGLTKLAYRFPAVTEKWYSQKIYPLIAKIISPVSSSIPVSLDDLFYVLLIIAFLALVILLIFKMIRLKLAGKIVLNVMAATYILFYVLWGFNYFRQDLYLRLTLAKHEPDNKTFMKQLRRIVEDTNKSWCTFEEWDKNGVNLSIEKSYEKLAPDRKSVV